MLLEGIFVISVHILNDFVVRCPKKRYSSHANNAIYNELTWYNVLLIFMIVFRIISLGRHLGTVYPL